MSAGAIARRWAARALALPSGAVLALAFPAPSLWWLAWVALVPLVLLCALAKSYVDAAWRGVFGALGFFLVHFWWLLPHVGLLAVVIGIVAGLLWLPFALLSYRLLREPTTARVAAAAVVLPAVWVTVEALRSWDRTGGAWALLGATQWPVPPVLAVTSLGGVWLLSFVLVLVNVGLAATVLPGAERAARLLGGGLALVMALIGVGYGLVRPDPPVAGSVRIAGVQPGVVYGGEQRLAAHLELTRGAAGRGQALVVWGQSSMPFDPARRPDMAGTLRQAAVAAGSDVLVNVDARTADGRIRKTAQQYGPDGLRASYVKRRLVPFGEYVPLRSVLGKVLKDTEIATEDRAPGTGPVLLPVHGLRVGTLISYESIFPDLRRELVRLGADVTVVQGSLTSFDGTWAQPQQASLEALRAVESGRASVLVELNGTSSAFDAGGRRLAWIPPERRETFVVALPVHTGTTLYTRWGDWVPVSCGVLTVAALIALVVARFRARSSSRN